jgi:hypothetical protein
MKFRNYCIVVMGNMDAVKDDIIKIAESKPRYLDAKGILIATFASVAEPSELKDFFNFNGRSFLLFDLDKDFSGYHLDNEKLNTHLFGYLVEQGDKLKEMSNRLMEDLSASTKSKKTVKQSKVKSKLSPKISYSEMSREERENILNNIIDKYQSIGISKITDSDKNILKEISESK